MLGAFAVLIVMQGALRKWFLPGLSTPLYVAKDIALIGALVPFMWRYGFHFPDVTRKSLLPTLLGAFTFVVLLQAFNFNVPSAIVGILGVKSYLLYTILLFLLPVVLERVEKPERLVTGVVVAVVPVLLLGFYQYSQPVDAWINQYVSEDMTEVAVMSRPRITGTFSYIGGMGAFLSFSMFLGLAIVLAGFRHGHRWYQLLGAGLLGLALVVAPMNGSRSVVLGFLVPLPFVFFAVVRGLRAGAVLAGLSVLLVVGGYVATETEWATQGWDVIEHRMENASDRDTRVQGMFADPIRKLTVGGVLGYGAGSTHQAAGALSSTGRIQIPGVYYEGELGRVIIELGIIGALLFLALKAWLAWAAWQFMRRAETAWMVVLSVLSFSFLFLNLAVGMIVFNHIAGALYWICAGCAVWGWSRQEQARLYSSAHRPTSASL